MKTLKPVVSCIVCLFITSITFSQSIDNIHVNVKTKEVKMDDVLVSESTTIDEVMKALGKPDRIEIIGGMKRIHAYDKAGVAFDIAVDGSRQVQSVVLTYNYDGDKKVAKEKYSGTLTIDQYTVPINATATEIQDNTDITKMICMGPMCISDLKEK